MSRVQLPTRDELNEEQCRVYDAAVAGKRGRAPAPMLIWLESPTLADRAQKLGEFARYETTLSPRLSELAILTVARFWTSQYEWSVHKGEALKAGWDAATLEDIAQRREPHFQNPDEQVVYEFSLTLNQTHAIPAELYQHAVEILGKRGVVELVGILGYYTLISMTLNAFEIEAPGGKPELT